MDQDHQRSAAMKLTIRGIMSNTRQTNVANDDDEDDFKLKKWKKQICNKIAHL